MPDLLMEFSKVMQGEEDTGRRIVNITGRIDRTPPHGFDFQNGVYRYLGAGDEVKANVKVETFGNLLVSVVDLGGGRWRFVLHCDVIEWIFEAVWPVVTRQENALDSPSAQY